MDSISARLSPPNALPNVQRDQHKTLEERFKECKNPTPSDLMLIAAEVGIEECDAKVIMHIMHIECYQWRHNLKNPGGSFMFVDMGRPFLFEG